MVGSSPAGAHDAYPATNSHALTPWQRERMEAALGYDNSSSGCAAIVATFFVGALMWTAVVCMVLA